MDERTPPVGVRWVRARVPIEVHDKVSLIAHRLALSIPTVYTFILTRELWDADPELYARGLARESGLTIINPPNERSKT